MSRLRRAAAVLLGVLCLQLTLLGTGLACLLPTAGATTPSVADTHGGPAHAASGHEHHGERPQPASGGHGAHAADAPARGDAPAEHQSPTHCPAATACAAIGIAPESAELPVFGPSHEDGVVGANVRAPASDAGAPEPPPPRA